MAIVAEVELARADVNDEYGVTVWQARKLLNYSTEDARDLAAEILRAADEGERLEREDRERVRESVERLKSDLAPMGFRPGEQEEIERCLWHHCPGWDEALQEIEPGLMLHPSCMKEVEQAIFRAAFGEEK